MPNKNTQAINRWKLGDLLKNARTRANLSQMEAAKQLGYSGPFLSQLEKGRVALPMSVILAMAKLYSHGDHLDDARFVLSILYLYDPDQWEALSQVIAFLTRKDLTDLRATVDRTVTLRLEECGIKL